LDFPLSSRDRRVASRINKKQSKVSSPALTEKAIETQILEYLDYLPGCFAWKNNNTGIFDPTKKVFRKPKGRFLINGISDIIGMYKGKALFIEVKTPKTIKRVSVDQKEFLRRVGELGAIALVASSIEDVQNALKESGV
jgi:hypothetical protein